MQYILGIGSRYRSVRDQKRLTSIDGLRGLAILSVVLFHFDFLPYGHIGVDLFFVLSGFLVSRGFILQIQSGSKLQIRKFFIRRAQKILPSYYFLLAAGSVLASIMYAANNPSQIIKIQHIPNYLFFYYNYRGFDSWSFAHLWSICVEEHFYLILPVGFLIARKLTVYWKNATIGPIIGIVAGTAILGCWTLKIVSYHLGLDTEVPTHGRIDALGMGIAAAWFFESGRFYRLKKRQSLGLLVLGGSLIFGTIGIDLCTHSNFWRQIFFHTLIPLGFVAVLAGVINLKWKPWLILRIIAAYSYNWYLWHVVFIKAINAHLGSGLIALSVYFFGTFFIAFLVTELIEEPCLKFSSKTHASQL